MYIKRFIKQDPETGGEGGSAGGSELSADTSTGGGESFDFESASDTIGADLGFGDPEPSGDPDPAPAPAPAPAPTPAPAPAPTPAAPAPSPAPGVPTFSVEKAPHTWSAPMASKWETIDPEVRAEIVKRETDMFRGIEQYKGAANFAREVQTLVQPLEQDLRAHNVSPQQFLGNLVNAHRQLSSNQYTPAQKAAMATQLLSTYGITLTGGEADPNEPYVDPQVKALQDELHGLKSRLNGADERVANETRAKIAQDIEAFATDPANAYFDEVAEDVALLIRGSGGKMPLKEAYDKAVFANPITRAKETARMNAEAVAKAAKADQERVDKAKQATRGNVRTGEHQASGTAAQGSMEDTMAATLASIKKR